jgi:hypothetical protein
MAVKIRLHVNGTYRFCIMCRRFTNIKILHTLLLLRYSNLLQAGWSGDRVPVGANFSTPVRTAMVRNQPPIQWVLCFFPVGKAAGAWP